MKTQTRYQDLLRKADVLARAGRKMAAEGRDYMAAVYREKAQVLADEAQDLPVEEAERPADQGERLAAFRRNVAIKVARDYGIPVGILMAPFSLAYSATGRMAGAIR